MQQYTTNSSSNPNLTVFQNIVTSNAVTFKTSSSRDIYTQPYPHNSFTHINSKGSSGDVRISRTSRPSSVVRQERTSIDVKPRASVMGVRRGSIVENIMADEIASNSFEPSVMEDRDAGLESPGRIEPHEVVYSFGRRDGSANRNQYTAERQSVVRARASSYNEDLGSYKVKNGDTQLIINKIENNGHINYDIHQHNLPYGQENAFYKNNTTTEFIDDSRYSINQSGCIVREKSIHGISDRNDQKYKSVERLAVLNMIPEQSHYNIDQKHENELLDQNNNVNTNMYQTPYANKDDEIRFSSMSTNANYTPIKAEAHKQNPISRRLSLTEHINARNFLMDSNISNESDGVQRKSRPKKSAMKKNKSMGLKRVTIAEHNNEQIEVSKWLQNIDSSDVSPCVKTPTFAYTPSSFNISLHNSSDVRNVRVVNTPTRRTIPQHYTGAVRYERVSRAQPAFSFQVADFSAPGVKNSYSY